MANEMRELQGSLHMVLNSGLAGQAFIGVDIPGFVGYPVPDMFIASYQLAAFYPFFRAHNHNSENSQNREPWSQSPEI